MTAQAGQALSHYRLVEKIGEGGMGIVWKAEDTVLHRTVAIKVLPPDAARDDTRRRMFLEEARLASSVSDARIVQIHDLGHEGDLDFIVMEFVEGKPLSRVLHGRPLPPDKVASLGLQVAQALARAHRKGLLHRDLKPGNILVTTEGDVKVVDFGLSMLLGPRDTSLTAEMPTRTTKPGSLGARPEQGEEARLVGTLPYMSPEQARAEKLDARSDIFSLGVVLYEMTTGQRPFAGTTAANLLKEIVRARPTLPHELVPKLPLELGRIIQKSLAPAREDRYQTMEDLAVDLKRLGRDLESGSSPSYDELREVLGPGRIRRLKIWAISGALVILSAAASAWWLGPWRGHPVDPRTVLILPFEVRGQTEGADYVGRAFAESIAVNLAQTKELKVLPVPQAENVVRSAGPEGTRQALELDAGRLVAGALTREGNALHASVRLVDAIEDRIVWGTQKKTSSDDLPGLAVSLAREIATQLGATRRKLYDHWAYLTGSPAMATSPELAEAMGNLRRMEVPAGATSTERLVKAFPNEPEAYMLRALALIRVLLSRWATPESRQRFQDGLAALDRIDPNNYFGDLLRASTLTNIERRPEDAIKQCTSILSRDDLTPAARAEVLMLRADAYMSTRSFGAALADLEEALRLDPANDQIYQRLGSALAGAGRLEEGLVRAHQAVALNPTPYNNDTLGYALARLSRWSESLGPLKSACEINQSAESCSLYALALNRTGRRSEAEAAAAEAEIDLGQGHLSDSHWLACYRSVSGRIDEARRLLRRSLDLGITFTEIRNPAGATPLCGPEFEAIVAEAERDSHR